MKPDLLSTDTSVRRTTVGVVRDRRISACCDYASIWVEVSGPKGGRPWQCTPHLARNMAALLTEAADVAERSDAQ